MKIATWNINSLRVRLPQVMRWLDAQQPDVLAMQETKIEDRDFPVADFQRAGYQVAFSGQPTYNGVAVVSRKPLSVVATSIPDFEDAQKRVLAANTGDFLLVNLYVPNGQSLDSDKYQYKLLWLKALTHWLRQLLPANPRLVLLGDFNIAPEDRDVHDPELWNGHVLVSAPERAAFRSLLESGLKDSFRLFEKASGYYSWWDYRASAFRRNQGLRIDHILLSKTLAEHSRTTIIDREPRGWERPSDHTPVIAEFDA